MEKQKPITQQSRQGGQIVSLQKGKLPPQAIDLEEACLLYTSPSPRDGLLSRMPSSA